MDKLEKLRRANEKDEAKQRELARKRQKREAEISKLTRSADTRRKVLVGSWAIDAADKSPEFHARMMRALDDTWLWRDDDRRLFGFELLSEEEKERRHIATGRSSRAGEDEPTHEPAGDNFVAA